MWSISRVVSHNIWLSTFRPATGNGAGFCKGLHFVCVPVSLVSLRRSSGLAGEMATKLVLERESRQYNWERAFQEIQSKERNSDRFTRLSTIVAYRESNLDLNRWEAFQFSWNIN